MTEIWYLLFNNNKLFYAPLSAKTLTIISLKIIMEEQYSKLESVIQSFDDARNHCCLLELQERLSKIDFDNEQQVVKLANRAKVASLELDEDEVLLVQVPGAILNSYFYPLVLNCVF